MVSKKERVAGQSRPNFVNLEFGVFGCIQDNPAVLALFTIVYKIYT